MWCLLAVILFVPVCVIVQQAAPLIIAINERSCSVDNMRMERKKNNQKEKMEREHASQGLAKLICCQLICTKFLLTNCFVQIQRKMTSYSFSACSCTTEENVNKGGNRPGKVPQRP